MKNIFLFYWFVLFIAFPSIGIAQDVDTVIVSPEVEVTATKIREQLIGGQSQNWSTQKLDETAASTIGELLAQDGGVFIKNYGIGSLATSSIRGGNSSHTLVLWNGLPIQSPMLGTLDLSLLSLSSAEEITLQKGGNSALYGSGAIGGIISMKNQNDFSNKYSVQYKSQLGSFGFSSQNLKVGLGNRKIQFVTKLLHQKSENDFFYVIREDLPKQQQTNASFSRQNLFQDIYWKINNKNQLAVHLWRTISDQNIPPTNVQTESKAHQDDYSTRLVLDWKRVSNSNVIQGKVGFYDEFMDYFDDATGLESNIHFTNWIGELESQWNKNNHKFTLAGTQSFTTAFSAFYDSPPTETKSALIASHQYHKPLFLIQTSLRQELIDGNFTPFVPSIGLDYRILPHLLLKFKASRNYKNPTLNNRYWIPGGNENLLPESGWSEEATIEYEKYFRHAHFIISLTGFNRKIDNWIRWAPTDGQFFWSAFNLTKVWSRGLESRVSYLYKKNKTRFHWEAGYDFIKSTNQVDIVVPRISAGDQLVYTPRHQAFSKIGIGWNDFLLSYHHSLTGQTIGINETLDAYHIGNVRFQKNFNFKKCKSIVFLNANNIWNANYFVVERRPMPRSNFQIGLNFKLESKFKSAL